MGFDHDMPTLRKQLRTRILFAREGSVVSELCHVTPKTDVCSTRKCESSSMHTSDFFTLSLAGPRIESLKHSSFTPLLFFSET